MNKYGLGTLRGILGLLGLTILLSSSTVLPEGCLQLDVLLVGDMSTSVSGNEKFVASAFNTFVSKFDLDEEGIRIGAIIFNSRAHIISHLSSDKKLVGGNVQALEFFQADGNTDMLNALYKCVEEFDKNGRHGVKRVIVIVSDGATQGQDKVLLAAGQLKLIGIDICGVVVINTDTDENFMEHLASPGCYVESYYNNLPDIMKKMSVCL